jgi:hypothetical protein
MGGPPLKGRQSVAFWARLEGIEDDAGRRLFFETPILRRPQSFREPFVSQIGSDAWARRMASQLAGDLWARRNDRDCREHVRNGLANVRHGWVAHCAGRRDLARAMFATAISDWLRTGMTGLGRKAGDAYLADQRRRIAGKAAHGSGPGRNRDAVLEAHEAEPKASNYRIAQMTGIPEATVRRHRPRTSP